MIINKSLVVHGSAASMLVIGLLLSTLLVPFVSGTDVYNPLDNSELPDWEISKYDFENYQLGDDPSRIDTSVNRIVDWGASDFLSVVSLNESNQLCWNKVATTAVEHTFMVSMPGQYASYNISYQLTIDSTWDNADKLYIDIKTGSQYSVLNQAVSRLHVFAEAGNPYLRVYNTSTEYKQATGFARGVTYTVDIHIDDALKMCTYHIIGGAMNWTATSEFYMPTAGSSSPLDYPSHLMFTQTAGSTGKCYIDNIIATIPRYVCTAAPMGVDGPATILTFDDGPGSTITRAFPILSEYGIVGDVAVIINSVGVGGALSWEELTELKNAGWGIAAHSVSHPVMTSIPYADACNEILLAKQYIEENITGYSVKRFVTPGSNWNTTLDRYARSVGYALTPYSVNRLTLYQSVPSEPVLERYIEANPSAYGGLVEWHTHAIYDELGGYSEAYDLSATKLRAFLNDTIATGAYFTSTDAYLAHRQAMGQFVPVLEISNDSKSLRVESNKNVMASLYVGMINAEIDDLIVVNEDLELVDNVARDDFLLFMTEAGETYEIMTESAYRSLLMDRSISPVFAIIPLVIIISVIPMVMGLGRKHK